MAAAPHWAHVAAAHHVAGSPGRALVLVLAGAWVTQKPVAEGETACAVAGAASFARVVPGYHPR